MFFFLYWFVKLVERKKGYYFSKVVIGENCHINPWHGSFKQGRNLVPFSCSKRNSQPDKTCLPFLKYVVKNVAFVVSSFRGLHCSCTLPVLFLPSFVCKPFANSGEGLHFFSPTILSVSAVDEGLAGPSPSCVNGIPEASSLALVPEQGTWYGILYPCTCILKLSQCFGLSKQRVLLPQNSPSTCFLVRQLWSNSLLLWTAHSGSFWVFLNLFQSGKCFKAGQKAKDLVSCGWCVLLEDDYIFKMYDSAGLPFHFRIIIL